MTPYYQDDAAPVMSWNGIGISGGWNGCVHLLKEPIVEAGENEVDAVTLCGRRLRVLPMSHLSTSDRNCRRCYPPSLPVAADPKNEDA